MSERRHDAGHRTKKLRSDPKKRVMASRSKVASGDTGTDSEAVDLDDAARLCEATEAAAERKEFDGGTYSSFLPPPTESANGGAEDDDGDGYVDNIYGADPSDGDGNPMDYDGHGTHCSGTIAAKANDGNPHVGVAWNVKIMAIKFFPNAFTSTEIASIEFAAENGAHIANCSYGSFWFNQSEFDAYAAAGDEYGLIFSCAAGNSLNDNDGWLPAYPCSFELDNIISVAATDRNDDLAWFSNYGEISVDLGAPGVEIFSTTSDSDYSYEEYQGTSMAAPHVAGVLSLMRGLKPDWTTLQMREQLLEAVDPLDSLEGLVATGGRLNAFNSIE